MAATKKYDSFDFWLCDNKEVRGEKVYIELSESEETISPTDFEIKPTFFKHVDSTSQHTYEEEKIACDMVTHFSEEDFQEFHEMGSHWKNKNDYKFNLLDSDAKHDLL